MIGNPLPSSLRPSSFVRNLHGRSEDHPNPRKDEERAYGKNAKNNQNQDKNKEKKNETKKLTKGGTQDAIHRLLDVNDPSITPLSIWNWDEAKLNELLESIESKDMTTLMLKRIQCHIEPPAQKLSFQNITYSQNINGEKCLILDDISGFINPGELIVVMGAPDSGVTSLLTLLAGRVRNNKHMQGELLYNGCKIGPGYETTVGYVVKQEINLSTLTVEETLYFSARLRVINAMPDKVVRFRVGMVMKLLGIAHVAGTVVGDAFIRGISGGEKRRVGFGVEMVAGHSLILADLPTNGLDSATAFNLIQTMYYACRGGFSIMMSLVQPSLELLTLTDKILLLSKGKVIYFGKLDKAEEYFKKLGFIRPKEKALPQFLEELSGKPDLFWEKQIEKEKQKKEKAEGEGKNEKKGMEENYDKRKEGAGTGFNMKSLSPASNTGNKNDTTITNYKQTDGNNENHITKEDYDKVDDAKNRNDANFNDNNNNENSNDNNDNNSNNNNKEDDSPRKRAWIILRDAYEKSDMAKEVQNELKNPKSSTAPKKNIKEDKMQKGERSERPETQKENRSPNQAQQNSSSPPLSSPGQPTAKDQLLAPPATSTTQLPSPKSDQQQVVFSDLAEILISSPDEQTKGTASGEVATQKAEPTDQNKQLATIDQSGKSVTNQDPSADDTEQLPDFLRHSYIMNFWYKRYSASAYRQFMENFRRNVTLTIRTPALWRDIWILAIIIGLIIGSTFYQLGSDVVGVRNRVGLFFYIISYLAFNAVQLVPMLASQRAVYYYQTKAGYYHPFAYYFSLLLIQIPIVLVETMLILLPVYGLSNLSGGDFISAEFWYAYLVICMNSLISRVWMFVLYAASPNEVYADVLNQVSNILFTKLAGYFIPAAYIVTGWYWMYIVSYFHYSLEGLALNDINPRYPDCSPTDDPVNCRFQSGGQGLELLYTIEPYTNKWTDVQNLLWFFIAFNFAGFMLMWFVDWSEEDIPEVPDFEVSEADELEKPIDPNEKKKETPHVPDKGGDTEMQKVPSKDQQYPKGNEEERDESKPESPEQTTSTSTESQLRRRGPNQHRHSIIVIPRDELSEGNKEQEESNLTPSPGVPENGSLQRSSSLKNYYGHEVQVAEKGDELNLAEGATLEFRNLCYDVESGGKSKRLLKNVYGFCRPGMLVALMGETGAGKSTLLDVLANRKTGGKITGQLLLDGKPRDASFQHVSGYVEQFDSHHPWSTVREAIEFSGRLRLPAKVSNDQLKKKVDNVLKSLGLTHLQNELIGGEGVAGVTQEVRKKVTIAVELVMEPRLLFLDEPTTGLDAAGAYAVVRAIKTLAKTISVVCTIHQPSAEIALMFDWLLLMQNGGEVVFFNPIRELPDYFKGLGLPECKKDKNVADYALEEVRDFNKIYKKKHKKGGAEEEGKGKEKDGDKKEKDEENKEKSNQEKEDSPKNEEVDKDKAGEDPKPKGSKVTNEDAVYIAVPTEEKEEKTNEEHKSPVSPQPANSPKADQPKAEKENEGEKGKESAKDNTEDGKKGDNQKKEPDLKCGLPEQFLKSDRGKKVTADVKAGVYKKYKNKNDKKGEEEPNNQDNKGKTNRAAETTEKNDKVREEESKDKEYSSENDKTNGSVSGNRRKTGEINTMRERKIVNNNNSTTPTAKPSPQLQENNKDANKKVGAGGDNNGSDNDKTDDNGGNGESDEANDKGGMNESTSTSPRTSFHTQFRVLLFRFFYAFVRNKRELGVRAFISVFMGFVVGTVFFQLGSNQEDADERIGALFVTLLFVMFTANAFLPEIFASRPLYFRETTSAMYEAGPFFVARYVANLPFVAVEILILSIMVFYIAGLKYGLGWVYFTLFAARWTSIAATYLIGTLIESPNNANTIQATYFNLLFAFTGFLIPGPSIPSWWIWFFDLDYLKYALHFLAANEEKNETFTCNSDQTIAIPAGYNTCPLPSGATTKCVYECGFDVLTTYGVQWGDSDMARNLGVVWCFFVFFSFAAYLSLKYVNHIKR